MHERLSDRARHAMALANLEAGKLDHNYLVVPEKSSGARYLLHEMRRSGGYALQETQGVWVKTLQSLP